MISSSVWRWLAKGGTATAYVRNRMPVWSRRAGGLEIAIDLLLMSDDERAVQDLRFFHK